MTPLKLLKGQQHAVASALKEHGYLDLEYATTILKIRNLREIIARLRRKGWDIKTNPDEPKRLYTIRRSLSQDVRVLCTEVNRLIKSNAKTAALDAVETLQKRIKQG